MSGKYSGDYEYDFNYTIIFRDSVLKQPNFMVPVISAMKGEKVEESNWVFLRKNEINKIQKEYVANMSIPHFGEDPRDYPEEYPDPKEYEAALKYYLNRDKTEMRLHAQGRVFHEPFVYYDKDLKEDAMLPALNISDEYGMNVMVLNRGPFPLLLYFNDQDIYEIILESAGMGID
jgi:hypothetical protein